MLEFTVNKITADSKLKKIHYYRKNNLPRLCCSWEGANRCSISFSPIYQALGRLCSAPSTEQAAPCRRQPCDRAGLKCSVPPFACFFSAPFSTAAKWRVCILCQLLGQWLLPPLFWLTGVAFFSLLLIQSCAGEERMPLSVYHLLHMPILSYQAIWIKTWLGATVNNL